MESKKLSVGDIIVRINESWTSIESQIPMNVGDIDRIISFYGPNIELRKYGGGHASENLRLANATEIAEYLEGATNINIKPSKKNIPIFQPLIY